MTVTPMFPLGMTLLPGELLPLRIFEPRYRQLVTDCLAPDAEAGGAFGIVLIDRGSEVGGGDLRRDVAVLARFVRVEEVGDGTISAVAVGGERMRILDWVRDDPYPRAVLAPWPEDDPNAAQVAYRLAAASPVGPQDRYALLGAGTMAERWAWLREMIDTLEQMTRFGRTDEGEAPGDVGPS
jgi:Lon protease-like protein